MAYQNVGTPRFYINVLEWLYSLGNITIAPKLMTLPVLDTPDGQGTTINVGASLSGGKNFMAMLNCPISSLFILNGASLVDVINKNGEYNGFRIATFSDDLESLDVDGVAGSIVIGNYYDMPQAPELSLTMSVEMDGIKNINTMGGTSLTSINYMGPPDWGDRGAWQLGDYINRRNGRRVWDLSWTYLLDSDLMPKNMSDNSYEHSSNTNGAYSGDHLGNDTSFYGQVLNRTMGGRLPFIFQPDKNNSNADQFAICRFDMNDFKYNQVSKNIYNLKLKIREVW